MKRRQRRPVLEINKSQPGSHGEHVQNKYKQANSDHSEHNPPANPLANLLCHYNSDSDTEDSKKDAHKLDDQVNNFLKEIQLIAPKEALPCEPNNATLSAHSMLHSPHHLNPQTTCKWRECIDESSGYPYYWHIETNEVTWEMPSELQALKTAAKMGSIVKPPAVQESHWVDFSSIAYQQSHENIPEGMIPREVVARNRNRYACNEPARKQSHHQSEQDTANTSDAMDDDSDDGRIEMITSYGSEESDSDTAENNQPSSEVQVESTVEATSKCTKPATKSKNLERRTSPVPAVQPKVAQESAKNDSKPETAESRFTGEKEITKHAKKRSRPKDTSKITVIGKASVESGPEKERRTEKESSSERDASKRGLETEVDFRVSLVPGYDEDSDNEEESEHKQERRCLFPIPQNEDASEAPSFPFRSISSISNKQTILDDNKVTDSNDSDTNGSAAERKRVEQDDENTSEKTDDKSKSEDDSQKSNKFLDSLCGPTKFFQRKKRIAFDVPPAMVKVADDAETSKAESETQPAVSNPSEAEPDPEPQKELGTDQQECNEIVEEATADNKNSVKEESNSAEDAASAQRETSCEPKDEEEVNSMTQLIQEKLKFLSEGKPSISPVQTMAIQLQTLFAAWEGGYLEKNYLRRWLAETSHELERLEQDAAPPGWLCQWDRSHKRYYYENASTGVTQWTYPDTGIAGGTEEMEICSTPPPADQEELISPEAEDAKRQSVAAKAKRSEEENDETGETSADPRSSDIEAPPPPQISNPSPPPPPRIYAEDLKKDKKRRDKGSEKSDSKKIRLGEEATGILEANQLENPPGASQIAVPAPVSPQKPVIPSIANTEPLPPGVDLPDAPYEIPATALKRILYNTVQGTSLYEAAARDPTVPILGHPIVQEHYLQYPAYHQHLHAPAALVLPHKHGVQPAIQLIPDYTPIYTNHKVIEKPPVKTQKESLVSALDSFYSDIARIEKSGPEQTGQRQDVPVVEATSAPAEEAKAEVEQELPPATDTVVKEKKRKKTRIGISKKHKEVSSMVAKWQRAQQNLDDNT